MHLASSDMVPATGLTLFSVLKLLIHRQLQHPLKVGSSLMPNSEETEAQSNAANFPGSEAMHKDPRVPHRLSEFF